MKKLDPFVFIAWAMRLLSLTLGLLAFQKISEFFLRYYVLRENGYSNRLYDYFRCLIRGEEWAVRDFLFEFFAPSLIALVLGALVLVAMRRRPNSARGYSFEWGARRFSWLCTLLGGFDLAVLVSMYVYYFYLYSGIF